MSRILKPVRGGSKYGSVIVAGSFKPAGTGTTAPTSVKGDGFTVAQSASGVFDVTFADAYADCLSFVCGVTVDGETTDVYAQGGDVTAATGAIGEVRRIRTMTGTTPTSIHADAGARVHFVAVYTLRT